MEQVAKSIEVACGLAGGPANRHAAARAAIAACHAEELQEAIQANDALLRDIRHRDARWHDDALVKELLERNHALLRRLRPGQGSEGGKAVLAKYGVEHFREMGRKGFESFTARYFGGDREGATSWLRVRAYQRQAETFADRELTRRIEAGEKTASVEMPVYSTEDDGIPF